MKSDIPSALHALAAKYGWTAEAVNVSGNAARKGATPCLNYYLRRNGVEIEFNRRGYGNLRVTFAHHGDSSTITCRSLPWVDTFPASSQTTVLDYAERAMAGWNPAAVLRVEFERRQVDRNHAQGVYRQAEAALEKVRTALALASAAQPLAAKEGVAP